MGNLLLRQDARGCGRAHGGLQQSRVAGQSLRGHLQHYNYCSGYRRECRWRRQERIDQSSPVSATCTPSYSLSNNYNAAGALGDSGQRHATAASLHVPSHTPAHPAGEAGSPSPLHTRPHHPQITPLAPDTPRAQMIARRCAHPLHRIRANCNAMHPTHGKGGLSSRRAAFIPSLKQKGGAG